MKALLPVIALLAGLTGGIYAASQLWPAERQNAVADKSAEAKLASDEKDSKDEAKASAFLKLDQPFVIPIQTHNKISEHVVLSISMETHVDHFDALDAMTPKLRAAFIITLYDHASIGSFSDPLDNVKMLQHVTEALQTSADQALNGLQATVLITNFVRQNA